MGKKQREWKQMKGFEKVFRILSFVFALAAVTVGVFAVLQILDVVNFKISLLPVGLVFLALENICNAGCIWRRDMGPAVVSLCCGVFVIDCVVFCLLFL